MNVTDMAGHLIRRLNQISTQVFLRRIQDAGFDLTPVQFAALDAVCFHPGIDQAGIATRIAYDRATIGGVVDRLEQKGLVERRPSDRDRRAKEVRLTGAGHAVHDRMLPVSICLQSEILAGLTAEERQEFLRLARKVIESAEAGSEIS